MLASLLIILVSDDDPRPLFALIFAHEGMNFPGKHPFALGRKVSGYAIFKGALFSTILTKWHETCHVLALACMGLSIWFTSFHFVNRILQLSMFIEAPLIAES